MAKPTNKTLIEALKGIDLTPSEAKVYLELLSRGLTIVRPIIDKTQLNRQQVYQGLDRLTKLKLATELNIDGQKHYKANSPDEILRRIEKKKETIENLLPYFQQLHATDGTDSLEVRLLYGRDGCIQNLREFVDAASTTDKTLRVVADNSATDFRNLVGDYFSTWREQTKKAKLDKRVILPDSVDEGYKQDALSFKNQKVRVLPAETSSPSYTRITKNVVSIEIYSDEIVIIQIWSRKVASHYIRHFDTLWDLAK